MRAYDFSFDNKCLSNFNCIIVSFDEKGLETIDGVETTFNTVASLGGLIHHKTSTVYEDCLEIPPIQVCKYSCTTDIQEMTTADYREILKWLNRKGFYKLKFLDKDNIDLYYMASIKSVNRIEIGGRLMGLELNFITNSPFPRKEPKTLVVQNTVQNGEHFINNTSYEEGHIYPYTEIAIMESGDLNIHNAMENRDTIIKNCVANEIITMDYPIITSSISSHNIQNDFNWNFFRIANTYENSRNNLTISIPCTIKIKYSPIVKVGI